MSKLVRAPMPDVIVVIPGITGSVLSRNGEVLWGYSGTLAGSTILNFGRNLRDKLWLHEDSDDPDLCDDGICADSLMPDLHLLPRVTAIDGYSKLTSEVKKKFDVIEGQNYFEFPYDWRRTNARAARQLQRRAHDWLKSWRARGNKEAKLIFLVHSMGGLVTRYFTDVLGGWCDTRAMFTFGTPFRGSLNALDGIANGIRKGPLELINLSEVSRTFTGLYQLLPIYRSYDTGAGNLQRIAETKDIPYLESERAKAARAFHAKIEAAAADARKDSRWEERGYTIYPIVGVEQETRQIGKLDGNGVSFSMQYEGSDIAGDGTVPRVSAVPLEYKPGDPFCAPPIHVATKHSSLQNADAVITHTLAQIEDFYINFGVFRGFRPLIRTASLDIEDLFLDCEPIPFRARASGNGALEAQLVDAINGSIVQRIALRTDATEWSDKEFAPVAAGAYRVRVGGSGIEVPAEGAIAVAKKTALRI